MNLCHCPNCENCFNCKCDCHKKEIEKWCNVYANLFYIGLDMCLNVCVETGNRKMIIQEPDGKFICDVCVAIVDEIHAMMNFQVCKSCYERYKGEIEKWNVLAVTVLSLRTVDVNVAGILMISLLY